MHPRWARALGVASSGEAYEAWFDAAPAADWHVAVEKLGYLLLLFADAPADDASRGQQPSSEAFAHIDRVDKLTPGTETR